MIGKGIREGGALLLGIVLLACAGVVYAGPGWIYETIDQRAELLGAGPRSLAYDSSGQPNIAFGRYQLYYGIQENGVWRMERPPFWPNQSTLEEA